MINRVLFNLKAVIYHSLTRRLFTEWWWWWLMITIDYFVPIASCLGNIKYNNCVSRFKVFTTHWIALTNCVYHRNGTHEYSGLTLSFFFSLSHVLTNNIYNAQVFRWIFFYFNDLFIFWFHVLFFFLCFILNYALTIRHALNNVYAPTHINISNNLNLQLSYARELLLYFFFSYFSIAERMCKNFINCSMLFCCSILIEYLSSMI